MYLGGVEGFPTNNEVLPQNPMDPIQLLKMIFLIGLGIGISSLFIVTLKKMCCRC